MKRFIECSAEWKSWAALCFSGAVIVCALILALTGQNEMPLDMLLSLLIISTVGTGLQYLIFGSHLIQRMHYALRILLFAVPFFVLLAANAYFFQWFPLDNSFAWLMFIRIFFAVLLFLIIGFECYFRAIGKKYDGLLGEYRKRREKAGKD